MCSACYFFTNAFQFFPEVVVNPSWIDRNVPYIPWTVAIYISYFILMFLPLLVCREERIFYRMWTSYMIVAMTSCIIFLFFPTRYTWHPPSHEQDVFRFLRIFLTHAETDFNAFPSLHVSNSVVGAFTYLWYRHYGKGTVFLIWGILVAMSTVTVKRHFFVDSIGAFLLAALAVALVNLWKNRNPQS